MKRKRIKKYQSGGFTPGSGFAGTNMGQGIGMFGGLAGGLIEGADMKDGRMSTGGALGSGALKGASMGMALGPLGALLGAGVGMAGGLMKRDQVNAADDARLKAERDEERLRANMENQMKHQQMNQVLDQFPVKGNNTPRFAMGGPTGGPFDTSRMMVPTFPEGAGPDAMPNFNFYTDGQQVSAQDYIAGLPQGQSINDHSQYWTQQLKPQFDQATGTWNNTGQGAMAQSAYGAMQKHEKGGDTDPQPNMPMGKELRHERGMPYYAPVDSPNGSIRQWQPSTMDYLQEALANSRNPFTAIGNAFDNKSLDESERSGIVRRGLNNRDAMYANDMNNILPDWAYSLAGVQQHAMGGPTMGPGYEVEGGEMMQTKGETPKTYGQGGMSQVASQEYEVKGPKHSNGGVKANDNQGARVYSDKLTVNNELLSKLSKL